MLILLRKAYSFRMMFILTEKSCFIKSHVSFRKKNRLCRVIEQTENLYYKYLIVHEYIYDYVVQGFTQTTKRLT